MRIIQFCHANNKQATGDVWKFPAACPILAKFLTSLVLLNP
jgi:hypothetical protein